MSVSNRETRDFDLKSVRIPDIIRVRSTRKFHVLAVSECRWLEFLKRNLWWGAVALARLLFCRATSRCLSRTGALGIVAASMVWHGGSSSFSEIQIFNFSKLEAQRCILKQ